jgi:hypothetical protein
VQRTLPLLLCMLLLACSTDGGNEVADTGSRAGDLSVPDAVAPQDSLEPTDVVTGPQIPLPADPLPNPQPGTYSWSDGVNKLSFAFNNGKVFVLEASFQCVGDSGCKVVQDFLKLTCNKAYDKGYFAVADAGSFTIAGIKNSDTLYGAMKGSEAFELLYELTPTMDCCKDSFLFTATWDNTESCADYATPDCDPYTDDNCPEGQNCIFGAGDKPVCMVAGDAAVGEACSTQGNCADGYCMGLEGDEGQHCYGYCKTANDCVYGAKCLELSDKQYKVCSLGAEAYETCNLLKQDCEDPGDGCYWSSSTINQPVCQPAGAGGAGDACTTANDCSKGYDCIAGKTCRKICNLTEGQDPQCEDIFAGCSNHYTPQNAGYCGS